MQPFSHRQIGASLKKTIGASQSDFIIVRLLAIVSVELDWMNQFSITHSVWMRGYSKALTDIINKTQWIINHNVYLWLATILYGGTFSLAVIKQDNILRNRMNWWYSIDKSISGFISEANELLIKIISTKARWIVNQRSTQSIGVIRPRKEKTTTRRRVNDNEWKAL